jgi:prepilin-type processing-associated H-X9-DG protein
MPDMKPIISDFKNKYTGYNSNTYYLFVGATASDKNLQGYTPLARNIGFIFTQPSDTTFAHVIAHELGHGAFHLKHSFDDDELGSSSKSTTNNLMDYSTGTMLYKYQWDYIHNPVFVSIFDGDDADAESRDEYQQIAQILAGIKDASRSGNNFSLSSYTSNLSASKFTLYGVIYSNIHIIILPQYGNVINPKNNIQYSKFDRGYPYSTTNQTTCLDIEGKIKIFAPDTTLLRLLRIYLLDTYHPKNLLLFVNGYRDNAPNPSELPNEDDEVYLTDQYNYWSGIDAQFINRIGTANVVYADGHASVSTSNHRSEPEFLTNLAQWQCASKLSATAYASLINLNLVGSCFDYYHNADKFKLHTSPYKEGFEVRRSEGMQAGLDLVRKINNGTISFNRSTDTLDIVCHSMGYAYALGMIQILETGTIPLGRFYCVAPENACSGDINLNDFKEVWQYGTNEAVDLVWEQDGVAPQCSIKGLENNTKTKGRAYIPANVSFTKGFLNCHSISNYGWIFNIKTEDIGYVKKR